MSPKINNIGFGAQGQVHKSRNHRNEGPEGPHITKSKRYKFEMEQNIITELLTNMSRQNVLKPTTKTEKQCRTCVVSVLFPDFLQEICFFQRVFGMIPDIGYFDFNMLQPMLVLFEPVSTNRSSNTVKFPSKVNKCVLKLRRFCCSAPVGTQISL